MPTYLVGPSRPYTTLHDAFAAIPSDLSGTGVHEVIIDAGLYINNVASTPYTLAKSNGSPSDYVIIRSADDSRHGGSYTSGVLLNSNASLGQGSTLVIETNYTVVKDVVISNNYNVANNGTAIALTSTTNSNNCLFENVLFSGLGSYGVRLSGSNCRFYKCLGLMFPSTSNTGTFVVDANGGHSFVNCGAYGGTRGFYRSAGSNIEVINCWACNTSSSDFNIGASLTASSKNNASEDNTAPGTSSLTSITIGQMAFKSINLNNHHLFEYSLLTGFGSNQSSLFTEDFDYETITTWSIGPDVQVAPRNVTLVSDENICPVGRYYAVEDFEEDGVVDSENMWNLNVGNGYTISNGNLHPTNDNGTVPSLTINSTKVNLTSNFKIAGQFQVGQMNGGFLNGGPIAGSLNYTGLQVGRNVSGQIWVKYLCLVKTGNDVQGVAVGSSVSVSVPTFTVLVPGISPDTIVDLSIEYDGISTFTYRYNDVIIYTESKPSGDISFARFLGGQFTVGGGGVSLLSTWKMHWAYYWPYLGLGGLPCLAPSYNYTSSSPWINNNDPHEQVDDADPPSLRAKSSGASDELSPSKPNRDAKAPNLKKQSPEQSSGLEGGRDVKEAKTSLKLGNKGYKNGFLSIMPETNGYSSTLNFGTGNRLPIISESLQSGQKFVNLHNTVPSREFRTRVDLGDSPGGEIFFPLRTNDSIPLLQSHFQKRIGTTPAAGTTYYEFAPNRDGIMMSGSAFGTGSYNSSGTYSAFTVNAYKQVEGSAYRFNSGLCDKLSFSFLAGDEAVVRASMVFNDLSMVATNLGHPYGSYSTLNAFPSGSISVDFFGLPVIGFELESDNGIQSYRIAGNDGVFHRFGRYQVSGRAVVDLGKTSLAHFGSMLGGSSLSVSATLYDNERNRMLFLMPNCRIKPYEMVINSGNVNIPFSCYESEDGGTAPLTVKLWTTGYSATSFQPN